MGASSHLLLELNDVAIELGLREKEANKLFGEFFSQGIKYRKYNNREVTQLIRQIIERYDLNKDLDMKDHIYLQSRLFHFDANTSSKCTTRFCKHSYANTIQY